MIFERLWDRAPFAVDLVDGPGADLVIAFASIGHDPTRPPSPEFVATATGRGAAGPARRALFVMDAARSWANDPGFGPALQEAVAIVARRRPLGRVLALGQSMGAFAALVAAQVIPLDAVLAFGPQWSVAPGFGETRWAEWTNRLPPLSWPTAPLPPAGCHAYLFHGLLDDTAQAMAFPVHSGTDQLLFPDLSHSGLVPHLKAQGGLQGLTDAALLGDRRRLLRIAQGAGGIRRRA